MGAGKMAAASCFLDPVCVCKIVCACRETERESVGNGIPGVRGHIQATRGKAGKEWIRGLEAK